MKKPVKILNIRSVGNILHFLPLAVIDIIPYLIIVSSEAKIIIKG